MTRALRILRQVGRDTAGATILEFALIAPALAILLMAGFDLCYSQYVRAVLDGEVAKAARDSALESGSATTTQDTIDAQVRRAVQSVARQGTVTFTRRSFSSYARVQAPAEPFIDANTDGTCNNGESYEDSNRNGVWDQTDGGRDGFSSAKDELVYTATVAYPRLFPVHGLLGWSDDMTVSSTTVLTIQPYDQAAAVMERACP